LGKKAYEKYNEKNDEKNGITGDVQNEVTPEFQRKHGRSSLMKQVELISNNIII
jgi:hypothetical protein